MASADPGLEAWADTLRVDAAAQLRRRERWLARQAADDASLAGVLVDHAENGTTVAVGTVAGSRHVGRAVGAGRELLVLAGPHCRVLIEVGAITTVQAVTGERAPVPDPMGHRSGACDTTLCDVLALAVAGRPDVTLVARSGQLTSGELVAVGRDVVMVRPDDGGALIYAPVSSLSEVVLAASTGSG
ncbi:MAG: hypothetical protein ACXIVQ_05340 [Acidimicrobiales bacterium]